MKILLINSGINVYNEQPPIGLLYLAAYLEKYSHVVKIVNQPCGENYETAIEEFKPDFVGITGTTRTIMDGYNCATYCKHKGIWTVIGGIHATAIPQEALRFADTVVIGEGEKAFLEIIKNPQKGIMQGEPLDNLDELPIPAWHLINMEYYCTRNEGILSFAMNSRIGCLLTSRGCPYKCTYCYNSFRKSKIRYSSPEKVIEEIKHLITNYKVNVICFLEDNFFVNKVRLKKICKLIKKNNLKFIWSANGRVDNVDEKILKIVHEAGCVQIAFGMESGSQRILDILKKGTTIEHAKHAIEICDKEGIIISASFMFNTPTETIEDIMMTVNFIKDNNIDGPIGFCITIPFPGTEIWNWCWEKKKIPNAINWSLFDYQKMPVKINDISSEILNPLLNTVGIFCANVFNSRIFSRISKMGVVYESMFGKSGC